MFLPIQKLVTEKSTRIFLKGFLAFCFLNLYSILQAQIKPFPIHFTIPQASATSAGIFRKDSTLVRTLWNNVQYKAGKHIVYWDRKDDEGNLVSDSNFVFQIITSNVKYEWEGGHIGNTSDSATGKSKHRYFDRPNGMSISGNTAFFSTGYAEGISSIYSLNLKSPQNRSSILSILGNIDLSTQFTATDGINVYWAGFDAYNKNINFIYSTKVIDNSETEFTNGLEIPMTYGRTYKSAIDVYTDNSNAIPSGLAVQSKGIYLFVAHKNLNELHVLNKITGQLVQTISILSPRQLCVDMNDNLWMISGINTIEKYSVNLNGTLSTATLSITGISEPLALSVSPSNAIIVVIDGGDAQQLKAFNNSNGNLVWTLGQLGGYNLDASVTDDKFFFKDSARQILTESFIAFQSDGSFWFGDPGNERIQHFSESRIFIETIMSMPNTYSIRVDPNNPKRVFNDFLEFEIDYSKKLAGNNGSWKLVKNWRKGVPVNFFGSYNVLRNVITLSNGRTYATMDDPSILLREFVELPSTGNLRFTGVQINSYDEYLIDNDGTLRIIITGGVNDPIQWTSRNLIGFDNNFNPIWESPITIASSPITNIRDPKPNDLSFPAKTESDILITFSNRRKDSYGIRDGYHLGAIKKGSNTWLWKTSKSTFVDYTGPMPKDGTFDIGNTVEYPGGHVYAIDNNIFWNYHGEFWKNSQTNIWNHFADNGLMVAQFGITTPEAEREYGPEASPMGAGNVFSSALVKVDNNYYLYHNDESVHGAVHRWKISGLNTIQKQTFPIVLPNLKSGGLRVKLFDTDNLDEINLKYVGISKTVELKNISNEISDKNNFSGIYSGFIFSKDDKNIQFVLEANSGIQLWLNDSLIINQWSNTQKNVFVSALNNLKKNTYYSIKIACKNGGFNLQWKFNSILENIDSNILFPDEIELDLTWLDLLEGLPYKSELINNTYGWHRFPLRNFDNSNLPYWAVRTNIKTYNSSDRDIDIVFQDTSGTAYVTRDLPVLPACNNGWEIKGIINYQSNTPNYGKEGFTFDIKDKNGNILCRITHESIPIFNSQEDNIKIVFNEDDVINLPYSKMYQETNLPMEFYLKAEKGRILFQFGNESAVSSTVFQTNAEWNQPRSIEFHFLGLVQNYRREVNISKLLFKSLFSAVIINSNKDTICSNESIILQASNALYYKWNTGETTSKITPKTSGDYSISVSNDNICFSSSSKKHIVIHAIPKPSIEKIDTVLFSNYSEGNQWVMNDIPIAGQTFDSLRLSKSGIYKVIVQDSNLCIGVSDAYEFYASDLSDEINQSSKIILHPNPNRGSFTIENIPETCSEITIIDEAGKNVFQSDCSNGTLEIEKLSTGLYIVIIKSGDTISKQILSIFN